MPRRRNPPVYRSPQGGLNIRNYGSALNYLQNPARLRRRGVKPAEGRSLLRDVRGTMQDELRSRSGIAPPSQGQARDLAALEGTPGYASAQAAFYGAPDPAVQRLRGLLRGSRPGAPPNTGGATMQMLQQAGKGFPRYGIPNPRHQQFQTTPGKRGQWPMGGAWGGMPQAGGVAGQTRPNASTYPPFRTDENRWAALHQGGGGLPGYPGPRPNVGPGLGPYHGPYPGARGFPFVRPDLTAGVPRGGGIPGLGAGPGLISGPRPDKGLNQYGFTGPENRGGPGWAERFPQGPIAQGNILPGGPQGYYGQDKRAIYSLPDGRRFMWVPGTEGQGQWIEMGPQGGPSYPVPGMQPKPFDPNAPNPFPGGRGGAAGLGGPGGPVPGWGGPAMGNTYPPGGAAPGAGASPQGAPGIGLPLTGAYEAGQRQIEDRLAGELASLGVAWNQIPAIIQLVTARLGTAQGQASGLLDESMVGRGLYQSGIRGQEMGRLNADFDRQRQDLAFGAAQQYSDLAAQMAGAYGGYQGSLQDLLLGLAPQTAEDYPFLLPAGANPASATRGPSGPRRGGRRGQRRRQPGGRRRRR